MVFVIEELLATDLLPPLLKAKLNPGGWVVAEAEADWAELLPAAS